MIKGKENLVVKPPVVVVLGHIDHGKSTLLEAIKKDFRITEKESGGITQHIGAYEVEKEGKKITFIDTPGHEAFSAMRSRGAKVADIAVLVVDAAEGVKEQTKEAIQVVKKSGIPMIVALNKIDKKEAQPEKIKQELAKENILVESLKGKIPSVNVSAKTGEGIEKLVEIVLLMAEVEDLKTEISKGAEGTVIENFLDPRKGPVITLILEKGILKEDDILATSSALAKVKRLNNFQGRPLKQAYPSQPVQILGFETMPKIGERFKVFPDIDAAKKEIKEEKEKGPRVFLISEEKKVLNIILKADVLGSLEAIEGALESFSLDEVVLRIVKKEIGNIGVSDIQLAESSRAKIFAFRVKMDETAKFFSHQKKIFPKFFEVIYELIEEVRKEMKKLIAPKIERVDLGKVKILVLFKKTKDVQVIGARVIEGEITKNTSTEVLREEEVIGKGKIKNIQQEKKDIVLAGKGKEIGILFEGETEIKEGDVLAVFKEEKEKKPL